ncbi:MAG: GcrA cell cycle regulator [Proteobacteria bacterium]|nr:GcrA cell cycle regulator [Pseudomonadota bacterium]
MRQIMGDQNNTWTPARIGMLQELWGSGLSAKEIAARLGSGITRNAVIGKAHRLGLSSRPSPIKRIAEKAGASGMKTRMSAPKSMGIRRDTNSGAFGARALYKESDGEMRRARGGDAGNYQPRVFKSNAANAQTQAQQCRWPMGDPLKSGFHFCERMSIPGMSYCYDHACMAYQGSKKKSPTAPKEDGAVATDSAAEVAPIGVTAVTH